MSTNALPNPKRRKLSAPKGATAPDADIDATVADAAAPKASSLRKISNLAKLLAVTALLAEKFVLLHQAGGLGLYTSNTCILEGVEHTPYAYFSLFWEDHILQQVADATNTYALAKRVGQVATAYKCPGVKQRWWKRVTPYELRRFLAALVYMGYTRSTPRQFAYHRHHRLLPKGSIDRRNQAERVKSMQFRRRTSFECRAYSPPVALCGPQCELGTADNGCFIRWHQQ